MKDKTLHRIKRDSGLQAISKTIEEKNDKVLEARI